MSQHDFEDSEADPGIRVGNHAGPSPSPSTPNTSSVQASANDSWMGKESVGEELAEVLALAMRNRMRNPCLLGPWTAISGIRFGSVRRLCAYLGVGSCRDSDCV